MRVQRRFPRLLIDYMMGVAFTERIAYEQKTPWELLYECVSPTCKMHEHILSAIKEGKGNPGGGRQQLAESIRVISKT